MIILSRQCNPLLLFCIVACLIWPATLSSQSTLLSDRHGKRDLEGGLEIRADIASVLSLEINPVNLSSDVDSLSLNFGHVDAFAIHKNSLGPSHTADGAPGAYYCSPISFISYVSGHRGARLEMAIGKGLGESLKGFVYIGEVKGGFWKVKQLKKIPLRPKAVVLDDNISQGIREIQKCLILHVTEGMLAGSKEGEIVFTLSGL